MQRHHLSQVLHRQARHGRETSCVCLSCSCGRVCLHASATVTRAAAKEDHEKKHTRHTQMQDARAGGQCITRGHPQSPQCRGREYFPKTHLQLGLLEQKVELARGRRASSGHAGVFFERAKAQHFLPPLQWEHPQQVALAWRAEKEGKK